MSKHFTNMTLYDSKVSVNKTILCSAESEAIRWQHNIELLF